MRASRLTSSGSQLPTQERSDLVSPHRGGLRVAPTLVFDIVFLQRALADGDSMRDADKLEIGKHDTRPLAAIVKQHFDSRGHQFVVQLVRRSPHRFEAIVTYRCNSNAERRKRLRPDDAALIVVLFDCGSDNARDADAVAPHLHDLRLT